MPSRPKAQKSGQSKFTGRCRRCAGHRWSSAEAEEGSVTDFRPRTPAAIPDGGIGTHGDALKNGVGVSGPEWRIWDTFLQPSDPIRIQSIEFHELLTAHYVGAIIRENKDGKRFVDADRSRIQNIGQRVPQTA